ncbi:hypothetical protein Tco_1337245, partial [Tanacetum coccineum]
KCNMRIDPTKTPKEPTYQVVLDALALTTCYPAFLITAEVPIYPRHLNQEFVVPPSFDPKIISFNKELVYTRDIDFLTKVYTYHMHQPWRTFAAVINKFLSRKTTLDKIRLSRAQIMWGMYYNKNDDFVELLWEDFMFQIYNTDSKKQEKIIFMHIVQDDSILGSLRFVSKTEEYQVYGALIPTEMTNRKMRNSTAYKTYLAFTIGAATLKKARKLKKHASPSKKKTMVTVEEPKKATTKVERSKGIELLSKAALLEEAQLKKAIKRRKWETNIHQAGGSSEGADLESEGDSDDANDDDHHQSEDERTEYDDDKSADLNKIDDEEETQDEDFVHKPKDYVPTDDDVDDEEYDRINKEMYDDVNVELKDGETIYEGKGDEEMSDIEKVDAEDENVNKEVAGDQVKDDAQETVIAAPATQKLEVPLQSSSILSDYATKFLNFNNIPSADTQIISMMDIKVQHKDPSIQTSPLLTVPVTRHTAKFVKKHSVPVDVTDALKQQQITQKSAIGTLFETMTKIKPFNKNTKHKALYHALMESILEDEDAMDKGVIDKKKTSKDVEPSKKAKSTETSKGTTKTQPKSIGKSAQVEEIEFEAGDTQIPQNQGEYMGNTDEPPVVNADPKDLFKKPERPHTPDPEWNECKTVDNKLTQKWLSDLAKVEKPSKTFDDLISTLIDFSAFAMNRLQISDLTQDILEGLTYKLLKGTCRSYVELEYNMEECYKALNDQLDWNNPKGDRYPFDLSKPLPLIQSRNRHTISVDYFFNNNLAYLQGGSTDRTYMTSMTKTKVANDNAKVNIWYGYGYLEEIEVRRSDQQLRGPCAPGGNITYVHKTYCHPEESGRSSTWCRKIPKEAQHLKALTDGTLISVQDKLKDMANNLEPGYHNVMPRRR